MSLENKHLGKLGYLAIIDSCLQSMFLQNTLLSRVTGGSVVEVNQGMKDLLLCVHVVVKGFNLKISCYLLSDKVIETFYSACRRCFWSLNQSDYHFLP